MYVLAKLVEILSGLCILRTQCLSNSYYYHFNQTKIIYKEKYFLLIHETIIFVKTDKYISTMSKLDFVPNLLQLKDMP